MDPITVVNEQLDGGQRLVDALRAEGFDIEAAFWTKPTDAGKPYLYLVSPVVDDRGSGEAYLKIHDVLRRSPTVWIEPLDIRVIGVKNSLGAAALDVLKPRVPNSPFAVQNPRPYPGVTRLSERTFGGLEIDWAYIYPPPSDAPAKQS